MIRTSKIQVIAILCAVLVLGACSLPTSPAPIININNQLTNTVTLGTPVASEKPGCAAIAKIQINRPETLAVGAVAPFSVTPKDSAGSDRTAECDKADGVRISAQPSDLLSVEDSASFETTVKGLKVGDVTVLVSVGKADATVRIPVVAAAK
jgi:hypothetical protein